MKFGIRTPSIKRRIAARTSVKRYVRHNLGLKAPRGMGIITDPKKALYNKVYNKTTVSVDRLIKPANPRSTSAPMQINNRPMNHVTPNISVDRGTIIRSSSRALAVTSKNFIELRNDITTIYNQRVELRDALRSARKKLFWLIFAFGLSYICIFGFFYKGITKAKLQQKDTIAKLESELSEAYIKLTFADKSQFEKSWLNCVDAFQELMQSQKVWDITYTEVVDRVRERTTASTALKRSLIKPINKELEFIQCDLDCLVLPNASGPEIFIYPTFLILFKDYKQFGIFDLQEVKTVLKNMPFYEEEGVPGDAEIVGQTWKKANKDGSRDKRFNNNYQIPIAKYGYAQFESDKGLQEYYMFSNFVAFSNFTNAYVDHIWRISKRVDMDARASAEMHPPKVTRPISI